MRLTIPDIRPQLRQLAVVRRPVIGWPLRFSVTKIQAMLLLLMPLTGFLGSSVLPTWRIANIFYVGLGLAFLKIRPGQSIARNLLWFQLLFLAAVFMQYLGMGTSYAWSFYDISWIISVVLLFGMSQLFFLQIQNGVDRIMQLFYYVAAANVVYQLYQQVMVQLHLYGLATILNEQLVTYGNTFFKIIGGILGSPGFMAEAGHLALFLAPLIGFQLVADYYGILALNRKRVVVMGVSLALTISSGAFLQFILLAILLLLIIRRRLNKSNLAVIAGLLLGIILIFSLFESYREAILYRFDSVFEQDSARFMGAKVFWQAFLEHLWLGLGPKSARFIGADPNFFFTTILADHGLVAGIPMFLLYFCPVFLAFRRSNRKLFIVPYIAMTVHLFLAYGTFTWAFIWMHICLTIWGLAYAKPMNLVQTSAQVDGALA